MSPVPKWPIPCKSLLPSLLGKLFSKEFGAIRLRASDLQYCCLNSLTEPALGGIFFDSYSRALVLSRRRPCTRGRSYCGSGPCRSVAGETFDRGSDLRPRAFDRNPARRAYLVTGRQASDLPGWRRTDRPRPRPEFRTVQAACAW